MSQHHARIIDGKALAAELRTRIARDVSALRIAGRAACLAAVLIGEDAAAETYAASQRKTAQESGIDYRLERLRRDVSQVEAAATINRLNRDATVSGIMLHLPVPPSLDAFALQQAISPAKDVEGVSAANLGLLAMGREALVPCTAAAAFACLQSTGIDIAGKEAVVVGRSVIVGKPLAMLLLSAHATVTQCHTRTRILPQVTRRAEILMVAAGAPGLIGAEHVAPGAIVIDVGTHRAATRGPDGKESTRLVGDVRFDEVQPIAGMITPVPGGVGPLTVAMLLSNVLDACRRSHAGS